jgi:O-antigen/teichoic acid export membrane protein
MGSLTIQNLATSVLGFVFVATLLRLLPQEQYGIYSAVLLSTGIASTCAIFGLNTATTRYFALLSEQDEASSWVAARKIFLLSIIFSVASTAVFLIISPFLSIYFTKGESWTWIFYLGGAYLLLSSLAAVSQGVIQGMKKYGLLAKIIFVSRIVMTVFAVAVLEVEHNIAWAIVSWLVYNVLILGLSLYFTAPKMIRAKGSFDYSRIMKYTVPLGVAGIITVLSSSADQVVVGGYLTPVSLGVYNAAITVSGVLGIVLLTSLTTALLPEAASSSIQTTIANGFRLAIRFAMLGLLPASFLMAAVAPQLLSLFTGGRGYLAGAGSLELISLFYIFSAVQTISLTMLQAIGKTKQVMIVGAIAATTDVLLAISLVPMFGIIGAAASKAAVFLIGSLISIYLLRDYAKGLDRASFYLKGVVAAMIPFAFIASLSHFVTSRLLTLVPYSICYFALFLVCIKFTKLLTEEDRNFLSYILPQSTKKYVKYL